MTAPTPHDHAERVPGRLEQIEQRLAAATPGPWIDGMGTHGNPADGPEFCEVRTEATDERTRGITIAELPLDQSAAQDADLIAHAPADLAALVEVVKAVREIHRRRDGGTWDGYCTTCSGREWPCTTADALSKLEAS